MFAVVWLVALLVIHTNSRLTLALGLTVAAVAGWICAHLDTSWAGNNFEIMELLLAAGFACTLRWLGEQYRFGGARSRAP